MDFIEELNNLSNRISNYKDKVKGERETINVFVLPFIRILGYDDANPTEVKTEFTADVGTKQGEKVDFAILKDDKAIMLIECKDWSSDLSAENFSQLYRYFAALPEAHIGVLTNGVVYQFYTDSEKENVMDDNPFFELNMSDIQQPLVDVLKNFTKDNFDLDEARTTAINLKLRTEIKGILTEQLETPTKGFVEFLRNAIELPRKLEDFTNIVKLAFREFLDEQNEREPNDGNESEEKTKGGNVSTLKFTNLRVTMPDGNVIHHYNGKDTYIEVLEKLGLEEVMRVRPNIVSTEQFSLATKGIKRGRFWVRGVNGFSTNDRKVELEKIADRLGVSLLVERVEKTPKSG
ncbi:MAG: type I restriction enzyme HsdR N-terminal domain-containing protein [Candidatus Poribacteria bacterium]|nr:type I restriction enzyme HsdR N-terminal domain-containing protein [Candidatus Poribacteria bacterium]